MGSTLRQLALGTAAFAVSSSLGLSLASRTLSRPYDVVDVPRGAFARVAALGHRTFLSDLYWLSAVQYIGEPKADQRGWDKLYPLIDLVTDLDPRHGYAYQTAGIVLSAAGRLDESDRILQKGMERGPPYWTFPYYLAFNAWFYRGDYAAGAWYARLAALTPGASPNISHLALSLESKSGTPEDAIAMLKEIRATVHDEATLSRLDEQLKLATLERDAQALEREARRFEAEHGRPIGSLQDLVQSGYRNELPRDPFGGVYEWSAAEKRVHSSANPFRFTIREGSHPPGFQWKPSSSALEKMPQ
jgi:tetratricopeptide (TPR) repeat protein